MRVCGSRDRDSKNRRFLTIEASESLLEFNPTRMCVLLVGLPDVIVTAVDDHRMPDGPIVVHAEARLEQVRGAALGSG